MWNYWQQNKFLHITFFKITVDNYRQKKKKKKKEEKKEQSKKFTDFMKKISLHFLKYVSYFYYSYFFHLNFIETSRSFQLIRSLISQIDPIESIRWNGLSNLISWKKLSSFVNNRQHSDRENAFKFIPVQLSTNNLSCLFVCHPEQFEFLYFFTHGFLIYGRHVNLSKWSISL